MSKNNRFAVLRELREQRQEKSKKKIKRTVRIAEKKEVNNQDETEITPALVPDKEVHPKKRPGRPPGRRSNPDYTQISAYVPLELILAVQDELARERRENKQRTARPVSDLMEELLDTWLKRQQRKMSRT